MRYNAHLLKRTWLGLFYYMWWSRERKYYFMAILNVVWFRAGLEIRSFAHRSFAHSLIRWFAHFAQIKWVTVSDSLRSLKKNERPWANRSFAHFWTTKERFARKSNERIPSPGFEWFFVPAAHSGSASNNPDPQCCDFEVRVQNPLVVSSLFKKDYNT